MARRKKRNINVQLPRDKEERLVQNVYEDKMHMYDLLMELEGDEDIKNELAEGIEELSDLVEALAYQSGVPKRLKRPWNINEMS